MCPVTSPVVTPVGEGRRVEPDAEAVEHARAEAREVDDPLDLDARDVPGGARERRDERVEHEAGIDPEPRDGNARLAGQLVEAARERLVDDPRVGRLLARREHRAPRADPRLHRHRDLAQERGGRDDEHVRRRRRERLVEARADHDPVRTHAGELAEVAPVVRGVARHRGHDLDAVALRREPGRVAADATRAAERDAQRPGHQRTVASSLPLRALR